MFVSSSGVHSRTEKRRHSLPARSMAYFAMGMALHSDGSYQDVLALISDGLAWADRDEDSPRLANKAAISHARDRLGSEPLEKLFARVAVPLAAEDAPGCWLAGRRLVAVDGTCLDLADTPTNDAFFGRPGVAKGEKLAFPQARAVALAECGTHAMFDAVIGCYTTSEKKLITGLLDSLEKGRPATIRRASTQHSRAPNPVTEGVSGARPRDSWRSLARSPALNRTNGWPPTRQILTPPQHLSSVSPSAYWQGAVVDWAVQLSPTSPSTVPWSLSCYWGE